MISKYEIHITTKCSLYELLNLLKSKGMGVDFRLKSGDCGELLIKLPSSNTIDIFEFKFYKREGDNYVYEVGTFNREDLTKLENIGNMTD